LGTQRALLSSCFLGGVLPCLLELLPPGSCLRLNVAGKAFEAPPQFMNQASEIALFYSDLLSLYLACLLQLLPARISLGLRGTTVSETIHPHLQVLQPHAKSLCRLAKVVTHVGYEQFDL